MKRRNPVCSICLMALWLLVAGACSSPLPPESRVIRISVYSQMASVHLMEEGAAGPLREALITIPGVKKIRSISRDGSAAIYVELMPPSGAREIAARIASIGGRFPAEFEPPTVETLAPGEKIPDATPRQKPSIKITVDQEKLAALGITSAEAAEAVRAALENSNHHLEMTPNDREWRHAVVRVVDGSVIRLSDIARIQEELGPDLIVRDVP